MDIKIGNVEISVEMQNGIGRAYVYRGDDLVLSTRFYAPIERAILEKVREVQEPGYQEIDLACEEHYIYVVLTYADGNFYSIAIHKQDRIELDLHFYA